MVRCLVLLAALTVLSLLPAAAPPAEPPEIARLADDNPAVRPAAMKALETLGEQALGPLRRAATDPDPDVRLRAIVVTAAIRERLWAPVQRFVGHTGPVHRVVLTPDGKHAVTSGDVVRIWDLGTGKERRQLPEVARGWGLDVSRDGTRVICTGKQGRDHLIRVFDLATGKVLHRLTCPDGYMWAVAFSPDGKTAVTAAMDTSVRLWDVENGRHARMFDLTGDFPRCVAWSPDGKRIAVGHFTDPNALPTCRSTLRVWDPETGEALWAGAGHTGAITAADWTADGKRVLSASLDGTARLWDAATGLELKRYTVSARGCESATFLPGGRRFIAAETGGDVTVWDIDSGKSVARFEGHTDRALSVAVTPDGKHAVSSSADGTARVWRLPR